MEDNFVEPDADPFDPEVARRAAEIDINDTNSEDAKLREYLERRSAAYKRVFSRAEQSDLEIVMADLSIFCRAMQPTWSENPKRQDLLEGRREVFLRIASQTRLDFNTLYLLYTDAMTKMEK